MPKWLAFMIASVWVSAEVIFIALAGVAIVLLGALAIVVVSPVIIFERIFKWAYSQGQIWFAR